MEPRIVFLERGSVAADFPRPAQPHTWVDFPYTSPADIVPRLRGAQVAVINKLRLDAAVLAQLPELRMIALAATGSDNIDLAACRARGLVVSNVRGYAETSVPEHVIGLMLALSRQLIAYHRDVGAGRWPTSRHFCFLDHPMRDLRGATLGLVGQGSLGQGVARLAEAFGMRILWSERPAAAQVRPGRVSFEQMLREADVVSLHCPLNADTRGMIDAAALQAMKPQAFLINTARGALVDEAALAEALRRGDIAGAAIDVLSVEPPPADHPLLAADIPNLILTPHVAWASAEAMQAMAEQVVANIEAFLAASPRNRLA
ncbi:D-2-hydroxyacid dehydrogenase [Denitromonas iodatirespirans]|uniref:D-2-hydroxyacid dehydrogenase n=1 Tax=Denitromonas iodatirespirans TaxID=2795389 RepID=A0A944D958_DENI1|nr:D-2-hydroxyacid dehydrogenase [Denitromonas iodatirespirans]MBT0962090.1 D-2-hydroxyacid dehydrogenase [Denitromonas iodatirespirans]